MGEHGEKKERIKRTLSRVVGGEAEAFDFQWAISWTMKRSARTRSCSS